jgi:hypothetical protein
MVPGDVRPIREFSAPNEQVWPRPPGAAFISALRGVLGLPEIAEPSKQ